MIILIAIVIGILCGLLTDFNIPPQYTQYMAVAILAALDSIFGGLVGSLQKNFKLDVFISGLVTNSIFAAFLTYIGNKLEVDIYMAAVVAFGTRLFQNFATIRRFLLNKFNKRGII